MNEEKMISSNKKISMLSLAYTYISNPDKRKYIVRNFDELKTTCYEYSNGKMKYYVGKEFDATITKVFLFSSNFYILKKFVIFMSFIRPTFI